MTDSGLSRSREWRRSGPPPGGRAPSAHGASRQPDL